MIIWAINYCFKQNWLLKCLPQISLLDYNSKQTVARQIRSRFECHVEQVVRSKTQARLFLNSNVLNLVRAETVKWVHLSQSFERSRQITKRLKVSKENLHTTWRFEWKMKIIIEKENSRRVRDKFNLACTVNTFEFDWLRSVSIADDN